MLNDEVGIIGGEYLITGLDHTRKRLHLVRYPRLVSYFGNAKSLRKIYLILGSEEYSFGGVD